VGLIDEKKNQGKKSRATVPLNEKTHLKKKLFLTTNIKH
jgi:hypothetical protein